MDFRYLEKILKKKVLIIFLLILSLGTFLRLHSLGSKSLWLDEIGEVLVAKTIIPDLLPSNIATIQGIYYHISPPLDYIILHFFLVFGTSEFIIRLPAAISGVLSILVIFFVGKEMYGEKEGLICSFLLAICPKALYYSQEARMYSLFLLLSLLSLFFFHRINKTGDTWKYWVLLTIVNAAIIYTHYFGFFVLLIEGMYLGGNLIRHLRSGPETAFLRQKMNLFLHFCVSCLSALALFLPWYSIFYYQVSANRFFLSYGLEPDLTSVKDLGAFFLFDSWPIALLFFVFILASVLSFPKDREPDLMLYTWICVPVLVVAILTWAHGPVTTPRNMIVILPQFLVLVSHGLIQLSNYFEPLVGNVISSPAIGNKFSIGCLILILVLSVVPIQNEYVSKKEDWRGIGQFLERNTGDADWVVLIGPDVSVLQFYYPGPEKNITAVNDPFSPDSFPPGNTRVWYVISPHYKKTEQEKIKSRLNNTFFIEDESLGIYSTGKSSLKSSQEFRPLR